METPSLSDPRQHPTLGRLDQQIDWYDSRSTANQRWFKRLKVTVILAGALTPLAAGLAAPVWIPGALGVVVVLVEAIQQLNQHQQLWVAYRATAEALKHEKYLFLGHAYPYNGAGDMLPLLAERVESLVSQEHAKWVSAREDQRSGESARK